MTSNNNEYNDDPIVCCKHCLWLGNVDQMQFGDSVEEYCPCCGSTEFVELSIDEWEKAFENRYKLGKYINLNINNLKGEKLWKQILQVEATHL